MPTKLKTHFEALLAYSNGATAGIKFRLKTPGALPTMSKVRQYVVNAGHGHCIGIACSRGTWFAQGMEAQARAVLGL
jgi:hypothetical protein